MNAMKIIVHYIQALNGGQAFQGDSFLELQEAEKEYRELLERVRELELQMQQSLRPETEQPDRNEDAA